MEERRAACEAHDKRTTNLEVAMFGKDGNPGVQRKVDKMGLLLGIVIALLVGNGGLLIFTLKTISGLAK